MRHRCNHRTFPLIFLQLITIFFSFHGWRRFHRDQQRHFKICFSFRSSQTSRRRVVRTRRLFCSVERPKPMPAPPYSVANLRRPPPPRPLPDSSVTPLPCRHRCRLWWVAGCGKIVAEENFPADDGSDSIELGFQRRGVGEMGFEEGVVKRRNWVSVNHGGDGDGMEEVSGGFILEIK